MSDKLEDLIKSDIDDESWSLLPLIVIIEAVFNVFTILEFLKAINLNTVNTFEKFILFLSGPTALSLDLILFMIISKY